MVSSSLAQLRAYDFRDEWPDLIQEVMVSVVLAARKGQIRQPDAFRGYVRVVTRNKLNDRLRIRKRRGDESARGEESEVENVAIATEAESGPEERHDLRQKLAQLPEKQRRAVTDVYLRGMKYEEAAAAGEVPLGSFKRHLRDGLAELRRRLQDDPIPSASTSTIPKSHRSGGAL